MELSVQEYQYLVSEITRETVSYTHLYMLKGIVKADGHAAIGAYLHGLLVNEIVIRTDGTSVS